MQLRKTQLLILFFNVIQYFGGKGNFSTVYACSLVSIHNVMKLSSSKRHKTEVKIKTERDTNKKTQIQAVIIETK